MTRGHGAGRPNVVFILADDLGWCDLGIEGSRFYESPHLDRLARAGMRFTQGYAACQVCSPSRASILTGKYPPRYGVTDWIGAPAGAAWRELGRHSKLLPPEYERSLKADEIIFAEGLRYRYRAFADATLCNRRRLPEVLPARPGACRQMRQAPGELRSVEPVELVVALLPDLDQAVDVQLLQLGDVAVPLLFDAALDDPAGVGLVDVAVDVRHQDRHLLGQLVGEVGPRFGILLRPLAMNCRLSWVNTSGSISPLW